MKIAIGQMNATVGDFAGNRRRMIEFDARAAAAGAELIVFPELSVTGYPPRDMLLLGEFVEAASASFSSLVRDLRIAAVVGHVEPNAKGGGKPLFNCASLVENGRVIHTHRKMLLPDYDVFDEERYFEPGATAEVAEFRGVRIGLTVCEDIWNDKMAGDRNLYPVNPAEELAKRGAGLLINVSASPFHRGKPAIRRNFVSSLAYKFSVPLVYVNQAGGNDSLVFDGNSMFIDKTGRLAVAAGSFEEDLRVFDIEQAAASEVSGPISEDEEVFRALVLGLRDYMRKCGFSKAVIGLSGGIDSTFVAVLAAEAIGPTNVIGVAMPSRYSSPASLEDAQELAANLGIRFEVIPIEATFSSLKGDLSGVFRGLPEDITEENLQARIRGALLMAVSNKLSTLVLSTGNKSEVATGYCTLYGDMAGGLAVISDVLKTDIYALCRLIDAKRNVIPERVFTKPPSAELKPGQTDQDTLPPYEMLDGIIRLHIEEGMGLKQVIEKGFDEGTVRRVLDMIAKSEYKRRQAAPGIKVSRKAFGEGRRCPLAQKFSRKT